MEALREQGLYVLALDFVKIEPVFFHLAVAFDGALQVIGILFSQHHIQGDSSLPDVNLRFILRFHVELIWCLETYGTLLVFSEHLTLSEATQHDVALIEEDVLWSDVEMS